ncbi:hypothetical protein DFR27_1682 [Umboniibacter marinipuniceus]|uniref:TusA-related sulfurtransferase n=1 Tax=Umboniibacter marinipuniceus TaxID=569599 RepID=A0A3M0A3L8_9GAMM|nr:hypothetical protein DFR27_1682 [Umboniibacter marinipuniceus]
MAERYFDLSQYRCPLALLYFKQMLESLEVGIEGEFEFGDESSCSDAYRYCLASQRIETAKRQALKLLITLSSEDNSCHL